MQYWLKKPQQGYYFWAHSCWIVYIYKYTQFLFFFFSFSVLVSVGAAITLTGPYPGAPSAGVLLASAVFLTLWPPLAVGSLVPSADFQL